MASLTEKKHGKFTSKLEEQLAAVNEHIASLLSSGFPADPKGLKAFEKTLAKAAKSAEKMLEHIKGILPSVPVD